MTLTEKIIAKACDRPSVSPNDNVWVNTDVLMTHDVCGPGTIGNFYKEFGPTAKVWDPEGVVIIPDHYIFTADPRANRNVDILRDFVTQQASLNCDIKYFYDITDRGNFKVNPDYKGVCHVALAQEGHTRPGEVLFGTDSHTCNAGAFGQFATGIGNTDASFVMGTGKLLIKSPASMQFSLEGEMPDHLLAKVPPIARWNSRVQPWVSSPWRNAKLYVTWRSKLAAKMESSLQMKSRLLTWTRGMQGTNLTRFSMLIPMRSTTRSRAMTWAVSSLSWPGRTHLTTRHWLRTAVTRKSTVFTLARVREERPKTSRLPRAFSKTRRHNLSKAPNIEKLLCYCVRVPTFLVPATQKVYNDIQTLKIGGRTLASIFREAGCLEPASPSCAACLGGPADTYARMNEPFQCVSTTNRNFPGRMGHKDAGIYLASPYTAAASAVTGFVTDPREVFDFEKGKRCAIEDLLEDPSVLAI
ncbi:unnamed protein product [Scytosiphon promiscuus]